MKITVFYKQPSIQESLVKRTQPSSNKNRWTTPHPTNHLKNSSLRLDANGTKSPLLTSIKAGFPFLYLVTSWALIKWDLCTRTKWRGSNRVQKCLRVLETMILRLVEMICA